MAVAVTAPHPHGGPETALDKMASRTSPGLEARDPSARRTAPHPPALVRRPLEDIARQSPAGAGSRAFLRSGGRGSAQGSGIRSASGCCAVGGVSPSEGWGDRKAP